MPDPHVDFMLRKYRFYLQERMHESGRLEKGTFNQIAKDLNNEFSVAYYERGQVIGDQIVSIRMMKHFLGRVETAKFKNAISSKEDLCWKRQRQRTLLEGRRFLG